MHYKNPQLAEDFLYILELQMCSNLRTFVENYDKVAKQYGIYF